MTDRPIIFSAPMVRALLEGRKTQTRRLAWKDGKPTEWLKLWRDFHYRPIPGHPDYAAGRDGEIYRVTSAFEYRQIKRSTASKYPSLSLSTDGEVTTYNVHRLVCEAWYGPRPTDRHEVRHLDSSRDNCRPDNLDWALPEGNWTDRAALGNGMGEHHHAAKLTTEQAAEIRSSPLSQRALAAQYGVAQATVWEIKSGGTWRAPTEPAAFSPRPTAPKLWVRENTISTPAGMVYAADGAGGRLKVTPSIHMPRWASRLTLTVTDVRQEPLRDISEGDARAEGVEQIIQDIPGGPVAYRDLFRAIWLTLHGAQSWQANPEVVAITFTVDRRNIDHLAMAPFTPVMERLAR